MAKRRKIQDNDWRYDILHSIVSFTLKASYRTITYTGMERIPQDGAVIFAPNHSGALLDALVVVAMDSKPKVFLARADIFKNPNMAKMFNFFKMMPIMRMRDGIEEVKKDLEGKVTLLSGNSGVGKSTLINAIMPDLRVKTGEISDYHNKGMHTTTFSEMFPLANGGYLIDTPGIKGFGTFDMEEEEVGHYFKEIFEYSANCKYGNCTHRHEPGCAVREAVEKHLISESRYTSYLNILEDKEEGKYRASF